MNEAKTPKIRFKGFSDAWEQRKLSEIGESYSGLNGKTKEDFNHGNANFITYKNIFDNPIISKNKLGKIEIDSSQNCVKKGDAFFTISSKTPEEVGMSSVLTSNLTNTYLNSFCFGFRPTESIDSYFLSSLLRADDFRRKIQVLAQGISRYNISKVKVMDLEISIPVLNEQIKIGRLLNYINKYIAANQRKLEQLKELKKLLMQRIFSQSWRFNGFTDAWEQRKLKNTLKERKQMAFPSLQLPLLSFTVENGVTPKTDRYNREFLVKQNNKKYKVTKLNDIVYNPANLKFGAINRNDYSNGVISPIYVTFENNQDDLFMGYLLTRNDFINRSLRFQQGTVYERMSVNSKDFLSQEVIIPTLSEQKEIGSLLSKLDSYIAANQRKCEQLQEIKKFVMQNMFV